MKEKIKLYVSCKKCKGIGMIGHYSYDTCPRCHGTGIKEATEKDIKKAGYVRSKL